MPRVTVLMPVHNQAGLLRTSLALVLDQTFAGLEVVVAGDGCSDESEQVAVQSGDPRVRWMGFPKGPGFGYVHRQTALAGTTGELIAYLAPDDLWAPDHLETLVSILDRERADYVFARPVTVKPGGRLCPHHFPFDVAAGVPGAPVLPRLFFLSPTQVLHTRSILDRAGGWNGGLDRFNDVDLWLRFRSAGGRGWYSRRPTALRLPALYFRNVCPQARDALHAELGLALRTGRLQLPDGGWPLWRRVATWIADFVLIGRAKGPAFARIWLARTKSSLGSPCRRAR